MRVSAVLSAIERDLRSVIAAWLLPQISDPAEVFGDATAGLQRRANADRADASDPYVLLEFLDWADAYGLLNRHADLLPDDVSASLRSLTPRLELAVRVRNRATHSRNIDDGDYDAVEALAREVMAAPFDTPVLDSIIEHLRADPSWQRDNETWEAPDSLVANNIPLPDYEETGLVGRAKETADLAALLRGRKYSVVTLVGEGGVGKTALALRCVGELVEDEECPYVAVVWASLKEHRLTTRGLEAVEDRLSAVGDLPEAIAGVLGMTAASTFEEVVEALEGMPVLIALDNAETAEPSEVLQLIDRFPRETHFLLTSRVGLGEVERRVPVGPLSPNAAEALYRKFAERRSQFHLARASSDHCQSVVAQLGFRPLGIRWFVEAIAEGGDPADLLARQDELLDYCIRTVYEGLAGSASAVATALLVADEPLPVGELAFLCSLEREDVQSALIELDRRSLTARTAAPEGVGQLYELTDLAQRYLRQSGTLDTPTAQAIANRRRDLLQSDEQRGMDLRKGLIPTGIRTASREERAAAVYLRRALSASRRGDYAAAYEACDTADNTAPQYSEAKRIRGFIMATEGRPHEALRDYDDARRLAPTEHDRALIDYWASGVIAAALHDPAAAEPLAVHAHESLDLPETASRLGRILMWQGRLDEAEAYLRRAHGEAAVARVELIARTDLIELAKRRVEHERGDARDPIRAVNIGVEAVVETIARGVRLADARLHNALADLVREVTQAIRWIHVPDALDHDVDRLLSALESWLPFASRSGARDSVIRSLFFIARTEYVDPALRDRAVRVAGTTDEPRLADSGSHLRGRVDWFSMVKGYGFVKLEDEGSDATVYFHRSELVRGVGEALFLASGAEVSLELGEWDGRPCAKQVRAALDETTLAEQLAHRSGVVHDVAKTFMFVSDDVGEVRVFAHQSAIADGASIEDFSKGDRVSYSVILADKGPAAVEGSLRRDAGAV